MLHMKVCGPIPSKSTCTSAFLSSRDPAASFQSSILLIQTPTREPLDSGNLQLQFRRQIRDLRHGFRRLEGVDLARTR